MPTGDRDGSGGWNLVQCNQHLAGWQKEEAMRDRHRLQGACQFNPHLSAQMK